MAHIYLSGPMTGLPDYNYPVFNAAADYLRAQGHTVHNPAEAFDGDTTHTWTTYMRHDIELILKADEVRVLPGWHTSLGATLEVALAYSIGIPVGTIKGDSILTRLIDSRHAVHDTLLQYAQQALLQ